MTTKQEFYDRLAEFGIALTSKQKNQFDIYAKELVEWNKKMNLTAITEELEIYEKHFLDSILPALYFKFSGNICDVGAGAGFPSIPMKIVFPDLNVTIVEPLGKRIQFLKHLTQALNIEVTLENKRSEDYVLEKRAFFDIVCARAVANLTILSEICIPLVKQGGYFIALKAQSGEEELTNAQYALKELGVILEKTDTYYLNDAIRNNYCFKKIKQTPMKYPRNYGRIKKQPLTKGVSK